MRTPAGTWTWKIGTLVAAMALGAYLDPVPPATANPFTVTTDPASGVSFFAGLTDDPFFFDIVGFNRFVASVLAGAPNAAHLSRGRDSFAGYNIHMITLSIPASLLKGRGTDEI